MQLSLANKQYFTLYFCLGCNQELDLSSEFEGEKCINQEQQACKLRLPEIIINCVFEIVWPINRKVPHATPTENVVHNQWTMLEGPTYMQKNGMNTCQ